MQVSSYTRWWSPSDVLIREMYSVTLKSDVVRKLVVDIYMRRGDNAKLWECEHVEYPQYVCTKALEHPDQVGWAAGRKGSDLGCG
jgi:hypothetical protein